MLNIWINPIFLTWKIGGLDPKVSSVKNYDTKQVYSYLRQVQELLDEADKKYDDFGNVKLSSAVTTIKSIIEDRQNKIEEKFHLKDYKISGQENKLYKKLEYLGIIKPILVKLITDLRNDVSHDLAPLTTEDKEMIAAMAEIAWYFLRSTDSLFARDFSGLVYYLPNFIGECPELLPAWFTDYDNFDTKNYPGSVFLNIIDFPRLTLETRYFPAHFISMEEKTDWLNIWLEDLNDQDDEEYEKAQGIHFLEAAKSKAERDEGAMDRAKKHQKEVKERIANRRSIRLQDCLRFNGIIKSIKGEIEGPPEKKLKIIKDYIDVYLTY